MIHTLAITNKMQMITDVPLERLFKSDIKWYWVDFDTPTADESTLFANQFGFHPLAIEDCLHVLHRPKLDHYDGHDFFVLHSLNLYTLKPEEVDIFLAHNYVVSFHLLPSNEIETVRKRKFANDELITKSSIYIFYTILDTIVDEYFPIVYQIEDKLDQFEANKSDPKFIDDLYETRNQMLTLRRTIFPMRELLYRILNSKRLLIPLEDHIYFQDIDDHLLRLTEMIESNRQITADMQDSYISLNSNRMNSIMKTLTIVASIFIPLTFIAGVYGMNFHYMPELSWHWGYFGVMSLMFVLGIGMMMGFWLKGWFK